MNMNAELRKVFMIHASTDQTEGRAPHEIVGFAVTKQLANTVANGKGPMGSLGSVDEYEAVVISVNGKLMIPIMGPWKKLQWFELVTEDPERREKIDAVHWGMRFFDTNTTIKEAETKMEGMQPKQVSEVLHAFRKSKRIR